jgi:hypothetical protein
MNAKYAVRYVPSATGEMMRATRHTSGMAQTSSIGPWFLLFLGAFGSLCWDYFFGTRGSG